MTSARQELLMCRPVLPVRDGVVSRCALFGRLAEAERVVQVPAPAGSGKTVLISAMAGQAGTDRWVMTGGIVLVGGCYLVTAAGLTGVRAAARPLLIVAGMAGLGIAASPEPARGATPRHLAWTVLGAVTVAV
jgi:hypothetical protein